MKRKIYIIIFSVFFIILLLFVLLNKTVYIDNCVYNFVIKSKSNNMTNFMKIITFFASVKFMILIVFLSLIIFLFKKNKSFYLVNILMGIDIFINFAIKNIVRRARPIGKMLVNETTYSFPSGHTMAAVTFYGTLIYLISRSKISVKLKCLFNILLYSFIILIMISRIYLGVHYFSDVIGGALVSLIYLNIVFYYLERKKYESINNRSK